MRAHILLAAAVFFEVLWAVALKLSHGFTWPRTEVSDFFLVIAGVVLLLGFERAT
jgi:multidrug transporter EmrE-like cation transporter